MTVSNPRHGTVTRDRADTHRRIARPSTDLAAARRFYVDGLGLTVLFDKDDPVEDFAIMMLGLPGAAWHLERTRPHRAPLVPSPTPDDLLVHYLDGPVPEDLVDRLCAHGGTRVAARDSHGAAWGVTVTDSNGYRLVLCRRGRSNG